MSSDNLVGISKTLDASYPVGLDAEAMLWRRVTKISEECGEVQTALRGFLGENPRKGRTHSRNDVTEELLDVAVAALGAVEHLTHNQGRAMALLDRKITFVAERLGMHQ